MPTKRLGLLGPAEGGEGPQSRGEPGIEHVRVASKPAVLCFQPGLVLGFCDKDIAFIVVPGWNLVAPPQLA